MGSYPRDTDGPRPGPTGTDCRARLSSYLNVGEYDESERNGVNMAWRGQRFDEIWSRGYEDVEF